MIKYALALCLLTLGCSRTVVKEVSYPSGRYGCGVVILYPDDHSEKQVGFGDSPSDCMHHLGPEHDMGDNDIQ